MQYKYLDMQVNYFNMQHHYVDMKEHCNSIRIINNLNRKCFNMLDATTDVHMQLIYVNKMHVDILISIVNKTKLYFDKK